MRMPLIIGVFSGIVGSFFGASLQALFNLPAVNVAVSNYGYLFPIGIAAIAILLHSLFKTQYQTSSLSGSRRQAFINLFELFHLGARPFGSIRWLMRAILSFLNAFIGGVVGLGGYLIELNIAAAPLFSPTFSLFTENRQMLVVCAFTAAISVIFNAPFSAALIVIGFMDLREARLRFATIFTSFVAYGTVCLIQHFFPYSPMTVLGTMFLNFKSVELDRQGPLLILVAIGIGGFSAALAYLSSYALSYSDKFFSNFFGSRVRTRLIVTGLCMSLTVWLVPEGYHVPWWLWNAMSELELSANGATIIMLELWILLVLVFAGIGSTGLFSPFMTLGALLGYSIGIHLIPSWVIPLAIVGGASMFSAVFELPFAASALVLDMGHDSSIWLLASCGILSSYFVAKLLKMKPLQELLIKEKGIRLIGGKVANVLAPIKISDVVSQDVMTVTEGASFEQLRAVVKDSFYTYIAVVSLEGKFLGIINLEELPRPIKRMLTENNISKDVQAVEQILEVKELMMMSIPKLFTTDSVEMALPLLKDVHCVVAVDTKDAFKGLVFEEMVLARYKREISKIVLYEPG